MRVKVLYDLSDAQRSYVTGEEADMEPTQALRWIKERWAESLEATEAPETAALDAGTEQAVLKPGRKK